MGCLMASSGQEVGFRKIVGEKTLTHPKHPSDLQHLKAAQCIVVLRSTRLASSALLPKLNAQLRFLGRAAIDLETPETLNM